MASSDLKIKMLKQLKRLIGMRCGTVFQVGSFLLVTAECAWAGKVRCLLGSTNEDVLVYISLSAVREVALCWPWCVE